jgi:hypothetical protein
MLYQRKDLPELHFMKHRLDDENNFVNYEDKILDSALSPYMYNNDVMNSWLKKMQPLVSLLFDQMNVMKNFKNYMVDKYYFKHSG